jgi:hypothetical protein
VIRHDPRESHHSDRFWPEGDLTEQDQHLNEVCAKVLFQIARPSQYNAFSEAGRLRHAVREMQL